MSDVVFPIGEANTNDPSKRPFHIKKQTNEADCKSKQLHRNVHATNKFGGSRAGRSHEQVRASLPREIQ